MVHVVRSLSLNPKTRAKMCNMKSMLGLSSGSWEVEPKTGTGTSAPSRVGLRGRGVKEADGAGEEAE